MPKIKRILFAIMGWGMGHATRCIPIIQSLIKDNQVILASNGISTMLLRKEFPDHKCIDYPDYEIKYPKHKFMFLPIIAFQIPRIIIRLIKEYVQTQHVVTDENIDQTINNESEKELLEFFEKQKLNTNKINPIDNINQDWTAFDDNTLLCNDIDKDCNTNYYFSRQGMIQNPEIQSSILERFTGPL